MSATSQSAHRALVVHVVGTRPNFIKAASVVEALARWNGGVARLGGGRGPHTFGQLLIHTGQHYDGAMSAVFFDELGLPKPDVSLGVGSGSHAAQTAALLVALEPVLRDNDPTVVVVYGDVNSTLAAALCASKLGQRVAHVEAGLRSHDRAMPEEINRVLTDHLADFLFTTSTGADENLLAEGIPPARIHCVGNVMIDTLGRHLPLATHRHAAARFGLSERRYAVATLHRPSNVDDPEQLVGLMDGLASLAREFPVVFPVHVRTRSALRMAGFDEGSLSGSDLKLIEPLGYLDFLSLLKDARLILTDSGGVQAEAAALGVACVTARTTTEWTETLEGAGNRLVDPYDHRALVCAAHAAYQASRPGGRPVPRPPLWDGHAADRLAEALAEWIARA